ncbi:MAG: hypothetical protein SFU56_01670 [Capsulimonadales bacterium]|nr:hypothetical protein [Capsulimonadales bacterium]
MNFRRLKRIAALLAIPPLGLIVTPPAEAQDAPPAASASDEAPLSDKKPRPLNDILRRMSRATGVSIVADSRTGQLTVAPPAEPTTGDNFESQIAALVRALPNGTTWGKLMLPDRRGSFDGDAVAAYADAQAKLFGRVGEKQKPGQVEIFGQSLSARQAEVHITGLNLVPVYLVTNRNANAANAPADPGQWANLSPQEKRQYARQQAAKLANTDPRMRNAIAQQYFMIFNQLLGQLSQPDRQALFNGMSGPGEAVRVILRQKDGGGNNPPDVIVGTP